MGESGWENEHVPWLVDGQLSFDPIYRLPPETVGLILFTLKQNLAFPSV